MFKSNAYTGVGSKETPPDICVLMTLIAGHQAKKGRMLRSGGAQGADEAFECGAPVAQRQIFRPRTCNGRMALTSGRWIDAYPQSRWDMAEGMAKRLHPAWNRMGAYARALHTRNIFQVLGYELNAPSELLICWTPAAAVVGGTATAIKLAQEFFVPVHNLADREVYEFWRALVV